MLSGIVHATVVILLLWVNRSVWGRIGPTAGAPLNATAASATSFATYAMTSVAQACQMVFQDANNVWSVGELSV